MNITWLIYHRKKGNIIIQYSLKNKNGIRFNMYVRNSFQYVFSLCLKIIFPEENSMESDLEIEWYGTQSFILFESHWSIDNQRQKHKFHIWILCSIELKNWEDRCMKIYRHRIWCIHYRKIWIVMWEWK